MFPFSRILSFAAAGAFVAFTAASLPARADDLVDNLGPVGPREPILAWSGSKRVIAFYQPDSGKCAVHVVLWNPADDKAESTVGYKATLNPLQMAHVDSAENESLHLQCSDMPSALCSSTPTTASGSLRLLLGHGEVNRPSNYRAAVQPPSSDAGSPLSIGLGGRPSFATVCPLLAQSRHAQ